MEKKTKVHLMGAAAVVALLGAGSAALAQNVTTDGIIPDPANPGSFIDTTTDAGAGDGVGIENVVTVEGTYAGPNGNVDVKDTAFENVDVVASDPDVSVTKGSSIAKATGNTDAAAEVGDTITYTYTVTNTGNVSLDDVTLSDTHVTGSGSSTFGVTNCTVDASDTVTQITTAGTGDTIADFGPDAVVTCTFDYVVTQADVDELQ